MAATDLINKYDNQTFGSPSAFGGSALDFSNNPGPALTAQILGKNPGALANPFTQSLLNTLGSSGGLSTLSNIFLSPDNQKKYGGDQGFAADVFNTFANPGNTNASTVGGLGASLGGFNPFDQNLAGKALSAIIYGGNSGGVAPGASQLHDYMVTQLDNSGQFQLVDQALNAVGSLTMNSISQKMAEFQLNVMYGNFVNSGESAGSFLNYLESNAANWLAQWWHQGSGTAPTSRDQQLQRDMQAAQAGQAALNSPTNTNASTATAENAAASAVNKDQATFQAAPDTSIQPYQNNEAQRRLGY